MSCCNVTENNVDGIARQLGNINSTDRLTNMENGLVLKMESLLDDLFASYPDWVTLDKLTELKNLFESY